MGLYIHTLEITFLIDDAFSLKDKRRVVRSMVERAHHRYKVSAAEIGSLDIMNRGEVGFAIVSNSGSHSLKVLNNLLSYIEYSYPITILESVFEER